MSRERGYFLSFPEGEKADTKAFIESRLSDPRIRKWAYIKQDKEVYTESDIRAKRFGLQYSWADGFEGMEKYSSCEEYVEEYMNKPPFAGDKKKEIWRLVCISDGKICGTDDISEIFSVYEPLVSLFSGKNEIAGCLRSLTQEDRFSQNTGKHRYEDSEVFSNFDFRSYIDSVPETTKKSRWKTIFSLPPIRMRKGRRKEIARRVFFLILCLLFMVGLPVALSLL